MKEQIDIQEYIIEEMEKAQDETNELRLEKEEEKETPTLEVGSCVVARYEEGPKTKMMTGWHLDHIES